MIYFVLMNDKIVIKLLTVGYNKLCIVFFVFFFTSNFTCTLKL